jgi:tetratricopeptide (TPR) repeat protein
MHKHLVLLIPFCLLIGTAIVTGGQELASGQQPAALAQAKAGRASDDVAARDLLNLQGSVLKLKAESEALEIEQSIAKQQLPADGAADSPDISKLKSRLGDLMGKLNLRSAAKKGNDLPGFVLPPLPAANDKETKHDSNKASADKAVSKTTGQDVSEGPGAADPRALANVLFKSGNFELALKAYRLVNLTGMRADERAPLQYLMATCLRKMGKAEEAAALYRDVANVRGDEQTAACAQWQLVQMRWLADFEAQLNDLHERQKALAAE